MVDPIMIGDEDHAPYIARGTLSLRRFPGITVGRNVSQGERILNGERFQEAINYAVDHRKFFEVDHGEYEIELAGGLSIPVSATGFTWVGHPGATIFQHANNTPILSVGSMTSPDTQKVKIKGVNLRYINDQSANTNSAALRLGNLWQCRFEEISVASTVWSPKCYIGCEIAASSGYFQNTMHRCAFFRCAQHLFRQRGIGTGNLFSDVYCNGTTTSFGVADNVAEPVRIENDSSGALFTNTYLRFNIEWCIANNILRVANLRNAHFNDCHLEENKLSGSNPALIYAVLSQLNFTSLDIYNNHIHTNNGVSGSPTWIRSWQGSHIDIDGLLVEVDDANDINLDHHLFHQRDEDAFVGQPGSLTVRNLNFVGTASNDRLTLDRRLPRATFTPHWMEAIPELYSFKPMSTIKGAWFKPTAAANFTVYGALENPVIHYPVSMGGAHRTVTLSNRMGPTATAGSNVPIPIGKMVEVRRGAGTPDAFNLIVANHNGATLATISAADTTNVFFYDGTNWVLQT